jgi:hypothetical protein
MIDFIYPYSYIAVWLGVIIGIAFSTVCIGLFSAVFFAICISLGMFRIMPLFNFINRIFRGLMPDELTKVEQNINESFKMTGNTSISEEGHYIFMWHPHGLFPTSLYFHTVSPFTDSPKVVKESKTVAFSNLQWLPFTNEIFHETNIIPSEYHVMKNALKEGSISLSPGGMREGLYEDTAILLRRRGIFKMALETGTPLVPVITKGQEQLSTFIDLPKCIQDYLEPFDACFSIPTMKTISRFLGILRNPLKDKIYSILGDPIPVEKIEQPTEDDIVKLRTIYIDALETMYKKEIGRDLLVI